MAIILAIVRFPFFVMASLVWLAVLPLALLLWLVCAAVVAILNVPVALFVPFVLMGAIVRTEVFEDYFCWWREWQADWWGAINYIVVNYFEVFGGLVGWLTD